MATGTELPLEGATCASTHTTLCPLSFALERWLQHPPALVGTQKSWEHVSNLKLPTALDQLIVGFQRQPGETPYPTGALLTHAALLQTTRTSGSAL